MIATLPWPDIDTVLLDMDGTLLDLHFDNHFWLELLPQRYAELHGISRAMAELEPPLISERKHIDELVDGLSKALDAAQAHFGATVPV